MIVRNLKYKHLNKIEQAIVRRHWHACMSDFGQTCFEDPKEQNVQEFWERHREVDTDNGTFNGWRDIEPIFKVVLEGQ